MTVARLNRVACRPGRETELERRLAKVIGLTRSDPDCEAYRWLRSDASGENTTYFNLSRWRTEEAWKGHLKSAGFEEFMASETADPCLVGPPEHHQLTEVQSPA